MSKSHVINVEITNHTGATLEFVHAWFETGRLGDNQHWPAAIPPDGVTNVQCCESDFSPVGCSGWVQYSLNGSSIYYCFSNPSVGSNGINIGLTTGAWEAMKGHYYPVVSPLRLPNGQWISTQMSGTGGPVNNASWTTRICDIDTIIPANPELQNVEGIWKNFPTTGTRSYYRCPDSPTPALGIAKSHFKGIASYGEKLILTHTSLLTNEQNGKLLIADSIPAGFGQGDVAAMYDTQHAGWPHPCSSQACGSFMAVGIQADESGPGSKVSQIQIFDIRATQVDGNAVLIATIDRPNDGVNGVGMTRRADGTYLVAGINGNTLTVYASSSTTLIGGSQPVSFKQVFQQDIQDSGPGLAMVTQQGDGAIYIFALNADAGEPSFMNLYRLDIDNNPQSCTLIGTKQMDIPGMSDSVSLLKDYALLLPFPWGETLYALLATIGEAQLNSSFRYGKGLRIVTPDTLEVYASDRNAFPWSQFPSILSSDKDFSLVTWSNKGAPRQIGFPIQASNVEASTAGGAGMILLDPVTTPAMLTTFNVMLQPDGSGSAGTPIAVVFDRSVDADGNTTFTVRQTSTLLGLDPSLSTTQALALATPLPILPGQVAGVVNNGPGIFRVSWVDGPAHHIYWPGITAVPGASVVLEKGVAGTPVVACGWNFTAVPLS